MIDCLRIPCIRLLPITLSAEITDYETLCKLVNKVNEMIEDINTNSEIINNHSEAIKELQNMVNYLNGELVKIANGEYIDIYIEALGKWIDRNLQEIVAKIVKQVFFGLGGKDNAYFVAWIPDSWSDIDFDTIMTCGDKNWGHLVLRY